MRGIWLAIFLFFNLSFVAAQFGGSGFGSAGRGGGSAPQEQLPVESDSINVIYFFSDNIGLKQYYSDTLLNNYFEHYDPVRQQVVDYAQLGNMGTPHLQQLYQPRLQKGLDIGFHQFDLYKINYKDLRFYITEKPFSDLYFAQGPDQENNYFKAKFTRNFSRGLNMSIDYKRMNNQGQFKSQEAMNTSLAFGFWYQHKNKKYDSFITYTSNTSDVDDNGGIDTSGILPANLERVFNIPVFLRSANTRYVNREYAYSHQYNFLGRAAPTGDSLKRAFRISHDLVFKTNQYKFSDTDPGADTVYYEHLLVDKRGLRYLFKDNSIENTFSLSTSKSGTQSQRDLLKVGLEHQIHFVRQEPLDTTINHVFLKGHWNFSPSERLKINTELQYNLAANFGDYRLGGDLFFDFRKAGNFRASLLNQLYSPSLLQQRMIITQQQLWKNNFDKTLETNLSATYSLPKLGFSASGQYHLINKLIYFDTLAFPKQHDDLVNILQLVIQQNFKVWKLHLDNTIALQAVSEDIVRLPEYFSKHNLYFEGKVFKKRMLLRLGLDLRLVSDYKSNYYQPLTGQFHVQDDFTVPLYPAVDAYTTFKVKHFRFFVRAENLTRFLEEQTLYYQAANYAQPYFTVKFGLSWQLLN